MNEEPKTPQPISAQKTETNELTEENLEKVAGGQTKVVGSSSNIKNNVAPAAVVASSSTIKTN